MKKKIINKRIQWALGAAFLCVVYLIWATYSNMKNANEESAKIKTSLDRLLQLENILVHIQSVETGQRGFVISGDENFLELYYKGLFGIKRDTELLNTLQMQSSEKNQLLLQLLSLVNKKVVHSIEIIKTRRDHGNDSAIAAIQTKEGKKIMDSIAFTIVALENKDRYVLQQSNINRIKFNKSTSQQLYMLAFIFLVIIGITYYIIYSDFKKIFTAEQQLKFNASLIRNISDPIITTDINNKITNWNIYACELFGFSEEEVLGKKVGGILSIIGENNEILEISDPSSKIDFWKGELIHYHKNGLPIYAEVTVSAIIDENGEKTGTVSVIRDITERKNTEKKLQRLTTHLKEEVKIKAAELNNVFERITDAFIALDNNWNYTYVNKKASELHNRTSEELIGKNIWNEFPDVTSEQFYEALFTAKQTKQPQRLQLYYSKTSKWFEDLIYPSPDGISVYYHDITDTKNAELALKKTHEKLSYHINNTPMGFVEFDNAFNVIQWSEKASQIFGWSKEQLLLEENLLQTLVYKEDIDLVTRTVKNIEDKKFKSGRIQIRNNTIDEKVIYCEWYISVLKDEQGNVTGVMGMVDNVTDRKQIQIELEEAEVKFRNLVEQSMVGVYIVQNEKFTYVNPRLEELTGYTADEMVNKLSVLDLIYPEDRPMVINNLAQRLEGHVKSMHYELRGLKKNGTIIYLEAWGTLTQYLGSPAIIGTLIDVTEKKLTTEKIKESQLTLNVSNERFMLVAKATNDAVWDWNMATNKIWGNEIFSDFFAVPLGTEVSFEDYMQRIHKDDMQRIESNLKTVIQDKQSVVGESYRFLVRKDEYLIFNDRAYIIYDENGNAIRMLGAMQDITEQRKNEQQIILEKELSDSIINSLPGIFYLFNQQGKFYRWNKNLTKITEYTDEEIQHLHPIQLFDKDEKELLISKIASVFSNGEDNVEAHILSKEGKKIPFYFTGRGIQYEGESCLMGVGIDISEKVKSQEELAQSEERYRTIIEQASDAIFISDLTGHYLDVNSNGIKLSGYSKEELLNLTIYDLMPVNDMEKNPLKLDEILAGNVAVNERLLKARDGSLKEVEISAKLLSDGRFIGIVRDITTRKKTQEALRISEEKYRLLFNQNPMPMWMVSLPDRKFLDVNSAAIDFYGYSKEEFLEMTAYDIRPKNQIQKFQEFDLKYSSNGISHAGVWEHRKKDATIVKVNIITHNIFYEGKDARLVLANDVTQKITAEEALKKSHEELRQLATHLEKVRETERTNIAREIHDELGQQLTGLKMDISWLNRKLKNQDEDVQMKINETIQLIDTTVKTVRRIATELRPSILDDLGLLAAMEWQSEEFEKRSEISCVFSSNVSEAKVNPDLATGIFRIYQECLTNVLRHSEATRVTSFLQIKDHMLVLTITDNGKGFVEKEIADKKTLGLLGMKERTNLLGGTYEITSKPGKGTSVLIIVPLRSH